MVSVIRTYVSINILRFSFDVLNTKIYDFFVFQMFIIVFLLFKEYIKITEKDLKFLLNSGIDDP